MCATAPISEIPDTRQRLVTSRWQSLGQYCRLCGAGPFKGARTRRKHERDQHDTAPGGDRRVSPWRRSSPNEVPDPLDDPDLRGWPRRVAVRARVEFFEGHRYAHD